MKQDPESNPTPSELAILQILWSRGPSTVREIHEVLAHGERGRLHQRAQIPADHDLKGLVTRTEDQRAHVYSANQPAEKTKQQFAADVLKRVFHGSASQLMQHALSGRRGSKKKSKSSAACSMNTKGNSHERDYRIHADPGVVTASFPVAGSRHRCGRRRVHGGVAQARDSLPGGHRGTRADADRSS